MAVCEPAVLRPTVVLVGEALLKLTVTVTAPAPAPSETELVLTLRLTTGVDSSSVIVTVSCWLPPDSTALPPLTLAMSITIVSAGSKVPSSRPLTRVLVLAVLAGIVRLVVPML